MNPLIWHNGTIVNGDGIQPDGLPAADFTLPAVGIDANPVQFTETSNASLAPPSSGMGPSAGRIVSDAGIAGPITTGAITDAPLDIIPIFASSITNSSSAVAMEAAIDEATAYYNTNWKSNVPIGTTIDGTVVNVVTVEITFGDGTIGNTGSLVDPGAAGENTETYESYTTLAGEGFSGSYAAVQADLGSILPNLPATDPTGGTGTFVESTAQADLLGLTVSGTTSVGDIGIETSGLDFTSINGSTVAATGEVGAVGDIEHEMSEVFGRASLLGAIFGPGVSAYSIFDLYRFSAPGTPALTPGAADYFSINGGTSNLAEFNDAPANGGDPGDWASQGSPVNSGSAPVKDDSFDAFLSTGTNGTISSVDSIVLANIGFQPAVCYREGTRILTRGGEKPVETLAIGDEVTTLLGGPGRVVWLGKRAIDLTRHPKPWRVWPVRIRAGAFAPGLPMRDLYVSPDHAVYANGVLVPAKLLINGSTIQQVKSDHVVYYHIELQQHDVILAEGLPAETYLDAGDRDTFSGGTVTALYPEFTARRWEMASCAPMVMTGPALDTIRLRLAARAEPAIGGMSLAGA